MYIVVLCIDTLTVDAGRHLLPGADIHLYALNRIIALITSDTSSDDTLNTNVLI